MRRGGRIARRSQLRPTRSTNAATNVQIFVIHPRQSRHRPNTQFLRPCTERAQVSGKVMRSGGAKSERTIGINKSVDHTARSRQLSRDPSGSLPSPADAPGRVVQRALRAAELLSQRIGDRKRKRRRRRMGARHVCSSGARGEGEEGARGGGAAACACGAAACACGAAAAGVLKLRHENRHRHRMMKTPPISTHRRAATCASARTIAGTIAGRRIRYGSLALCNTSLRSPEFAQTDGSTTSRAKSAESLFSCTQSVRRVMLLPTAAKTGCRTLSRAPQ